MEPAHGREGIAEAIPSSTGLFQLIKVERPQPGEKRERFRPEIVQIGVGQRLKRSALIEQRYLAIDPGAEVDTVRGTLFRLSWDAHKLSAISYQPKADR